MGRLMRRNRQTAEAVRRACHPTTPHLMRKEKHTMAFFKDLLKEIVKDELASVIAEERGNTSADDTSALGSNDDINKDDATEDDTHEDDTHKDDKADEDQQKKFNVELRQMIQKELRGVAADMLNKQKGSDAPTISADDVYAEMLGFSTKKKGD